MSRALEPAAVDAGHDKARVPARPALRLEEGSAVTVLGPSGADKPTMLLVADLRGRAPVRARRAGLPGLTVTENLHVFSPGQERRCASHAPGAHSALDLTQSNVAAHRERR